MYRRVFVICSILSFISVSLNTPETLFHSKELTYMLLFIDVVTGIVLTIEAIVKIKLKGLLRVSCFIIDLYIQLQFKLSLLNCPLLKNNIGLIREWIILLTRLTIRPGLAFKLHFLLLKIFICRIGAPLAATCCTEPPQ